MGYLFSLNALRQGEHYINPDTLSSMMNQSNAELRLSLNDLIANTIYEFLDKENETPEEARENRLTTEDAAESVLGILGITIADGLTLDNKITAVITRNIPDEFSV